MGMACPLKGTLSPGRLTCSGRRLAALPCAMFRIFSTPNTSVSPSETMNSHDAYVRASIRIVGKALMRR